MSVRLFCPVASPAVVQAMTASWAVLPWWLLGVLRARMHGSRPSDLRSWLLVALASLARVPLVSCLTTVLLSQPPKAPATSSRCRVMADLAVTVRV